MHTPVSKPSKPIPKRLLDLFERVNFIASTPKGMKLCVGSKSYVDADSWLYGAYRWITSERQEFRGNEEVRKCCNIITDAYTEYTGTEFEILIYERMLSLKDGIENILASYDANINKKRAADNLKDSLMILNRAMVTSKPGLSLASSPIDSPTASRGIYPSVSSVLRINGLASQSVFADNSNQAGQSSGGVSDE